MTKIFVADSERGDLEPVDSFTADKPLEKPATVINLSTGFLSTGLFLRDPVLYAKYMDFQQTQVNFAALFILLLYSAITIYRSTRVTLSMQSPLTLINLLVSIVLVVGVGLVSILIRLFGRFHPEVHQKISFSTLTILDSIWLFGFNIWFCINIVLSGNYGHYVRSGLFDCNSSPKTLDSDKIISALMCPLLLYIIVRSAKWEAVLVSYVMNSVVIIGTIFGYNLNKSFGQFLMFVPVTTMLLFEYQRQIVSLFEFSVKQQKIQEENDRLAEEAHSTELRHMIGNVAHDLKTPLSAFVCGVELIKSLAEEMHKALQQQQMLNREMLGANVGAILENVVNVINTNSFMLMTINRCIDYTKASKNMKLTPRLETFNLQEAINLPMHCMKDLQSDRVHIGAVPLSRNIAPYIITDKQWLQENILCLLSNAVKYSSRGMVMLSVALVNSHYSESGRGDLSSRTIKDDESVGVRQVLRVEVEDTGIGLTDEVMANLFKPFKQAQRLAGGTGLGLFSLAKRMEALGGWYGVQKRRDGQQGSIFWFEIPYRPDNEASMNCVRSFSDDDQLTPMAKSGRKIEIISVLSGSNKEKIYREGKLNILIVDDSPSILKMSSKMLEKQGYNITTAEDGAQALDKVLESKKPGARKFDCVLMDLQMPVMDGLESTSRIRRFEAMNDDLDRLVIVGVSANSDTETMNDAYKAGVDAFIPKPFNFKLFDEVYQGVCDKRNCCEL